VGCKDRLQGQNQEIEELTSKYRKAQSRIDVLSRDNNDLMAQLNAMAENDIIFLSSHFS